MLPRPVEGEPGLVIIDATWGTIRPIQLHSDVRTLGELEVIEHLRAGGPAVDTRQPHDYAAGTIHGAVNVPHEIIEADPAMLDARLTVLFCNGPQCAATPAAIRALLSAGRPPATILWYRGGIHDWVSLGLPLERVTA